MKTVKAILHFRSATKEEWAAENPVLGVSEPGIEMPSRAMKIGDGVTAWKDLPYQVEAGRGIILSDNAQIEVETPVQGVTQDVFSKMSEADKKGLVIVTDADSYPGNLKPLSEVTAEVTNATPGTPEAAVQYEETDEDYRIHFLFSHLKGEPGESGTDGVSPVIAAADTEDGVELTITDANGTQSVTIYDGEPGPQGADGKDITGLTQAEYDALSDKTGMYIIVDDMTENENRNVYVEEEVQIGSYLGKPLYRKIHFGKFPDNSSAAANAINYELPGVDVMLKAYGYSILSGNTTPIPSYYLTYLYNVTREAFFVGGSGKSAYSYLDYVLIMEYTKKES